MSDKPLTDIPFSEFELHPQLLAGLEAAGFLRCTPIQALTLPIALGGRDVAGQAQTGTGKTLAFLVAVVNRLLSRPALADRKPEDPRALILAPTRELAIQIHKDAVKFCSDLGLKFALVYGGVDYDKQRQLLQDGADVIIATPGRLIDYVKQHKVVSLHACEMCVLDEADRMFDLGFIKDIRFLLRRMPIRTERQTLLFSATLSHRVLELAYEHMNEPEKLVVEAETVTAARVRQKLYYPADEEKIPLLLGLLSRSEGARTMVFVNTKAFVERVARALERGGYRVGVLSGDVPQKKRESLLRKFQAGQLELLVATDVAARGLHIDGVSHVFNYDLPFDAEDYVHRIGRTARLGAEGDAISFACERYAMSLPDIEAYIEQKIPSEPVTPDLLQSLPRKPREGVELQAEEGESIGEIFREAREQRAADDARRGIVRKGGPRRSGEGGSRPGTDRPRRAPRRAADDTTPATGAAGAAANAAETVAGEAAAANGAAAAGVRTGAPAAGAVAAGGDEAAPARKRRRRRGGRRKDGEGAGAASQDGAPQDAARQEDRGSRSARGDRGHGASGEARGEAGARKPRAPRKPRVAGAADTPASATPVRAKAPRHDAAAASAGQPSLLSRIGRGLRRLVGGSSDAR